MDLLRTCVMLVLLAPASCQKDFLTHPLTCYILDAFLLAYCIIATMVYLKLKFFSTPRVTAEEPYLQRPLNPDLYQELEPLAQKKKGAKKKKPQNTPK
ncbi:T-cell surface glycoprotein CD3 zeta chain-like [Takifugu flavidus]|uniref:T-cell surface glycoprotein CD3 zeta chain-like n=1 Tax=Takifugu flavidus TaxID=433684 RepID=UPI0025445A3A|nr:T-cell surface glycoprotein CD3 zeta chain-like [Takifugu flavidus]